MCVRPIHVILSKSKYSYNLTSIVALAQKLQKSEQIFCKLIIL